jgi:hypothetical protein
VIDYEGAAHAIAIGYVTDPSDIRPLDWSDMTPETRTFEELKTFCNLDTLTNVIKKRIPFDSRRPLELEVIYWLMQAWNLTTGNETDVVVVQADGTTHSLLSLKSSPNQKFVWIRLHNDRWEGCGYFQDSVPSTSSLQPSNAMSAISQIDIKPVTKTEALVDDLTGDPASRADTMDKRAIEAMKKFTREHSIDPVTSIRTLCCWIVMLGFSHDEALRSRKHEFLSEIVKLGTTALDITRIIRDGATDKEKDAFTTKWQERLQKELKAHAKHNGFKTAGEKGEEEEAKQSEGGDVKQEQDEDHKQQQDKNTKQEHDEDVKQREDEDAKQRKREEAEAIAAEYAAQDRYDSCSDSDGE